MPFEDIKIPDVPKLPDKVQERFPELQTWLDEEFKDFIKKLAIAIRAG